MLKVDWHSNKTWGIIGIVFTVLTLLLGMFLQPYLGRETQSKIWAYLWGNLLAIVTVFLVLVLLIKIVRQGRDLRLLRKKMSTEEGPTFRRFEQIKSVKYGHIAYRPFLYYDEGDNPQGIGVTLLRRVFNQKGVVGSHRKALWSDLVENLASKKYDVVATPIFETRERSKVIAFCSPMFYSDIGMYVKKSSRFLGHLTPNSQTFEDAVDMARRMKPRIVAIQGEISGKMALKYLDLKREDVKEWLTPETASVNSLIAAVKGDNGMECEVVFAEVFQAEHTDAVRTGAVINILKPKQVLYPVSFAVRKSDYVLKNYINLRLLEIEETVKDGILGIILEELRKYQQFSHYSLNDIRRYFVRDLDGEFGITSENIGPTESEPPSNAGAIQQMGQPKVKSFLNHKRKPDSPDKETQQRRLGSATTGDAYA